MEREPTFDELRRAHEELARRVYADRLAFADRVQEVLDEADRLQAAIDDRDEQIGALTADAEALRNRVESLHQELVEAHRIIERSRSHRASALLRRFTGVFRRA